VTITNEPEAMEGSSRNFSNVNPLLPPVMATVWPYVLSGIQSEAQNDSPDVYNIISVFGGRENGQSGTPFEQLGHFESLTN
jgi:hypothetical protein